MMLTIIYRRGLHLSLILFKIMNFIKRKLAVRYLNREIARITDSIAIKKDRHKARKNIQSAQVQLEVAYQRGRKCNKIIK